MPPLWLRHAHGRATASTGARPSTSCKPRSAMPRRPPRAAPCVPAPPTARLGSVSRGIELPASKFQQLTMYFAAEFWYRQIVHQIIPLHYLRAECDLILINKG